jgi:nitric oxide reductase NorD protein
MVKPPEDSMAALALADPELAASVTAGLEPKGIPDSHPELPRMSADIIWALSLERSFGEAFAKGYVCLIGEVTSAVITRYRTEVCQAGKRGPAFGRIMAMHLPLVLKSTDQSLPNRFFQAVEILSEKGMHLLHEPLEGVSHLLAGGEHAGGMAFLNLLCEVFSAPLTYNRARALSHLLPTALAKLPSEKRSWQIRESYRVACVSGDLTDPFLAGIERGLHLLTEEALCDFVTTGLEKYSRNKELGRSFLSLESQISRRRLTELQVCVPLAQVKESLNRYLRARSRIELSVAALSQLSATVFGVVAPPMVCSDNRFIYLPDEISMFSTQAQNLSLYKLLTKLEMGYHEFGTYDFDLEKLMARCPQWHPGPSVDTAFSDLERFFMSFPLPMLARDLFTLFESARLRILMAVSYPGLLRQLIPLLASEIKRLGQFDPPRDTHLALVAEMTLGPGSALHCGVGADAAGNMRAICQSLETAICNNPVVETGAQLVIDCYEDARFRGSAFPIPFGRRVRPDLVRSSSLAEDRLAGRIKAGLAAKRLKVYRSDLRRHLIENNGRMSSEDLALLLQPAPPGQACCISASPEIDAILTEILSDISSTSRSDGPELGTSGAVFWYREWDCGISDYRADHVRVVEKEIIGRTDTAYRQALRLNRSQVKKIRYAFELLKPEALAILRHWIEGDEFDYRALIDAAIDRKMGRIPSERLYIKRLKQQRDVAVLLLVDLSRSTANLVAGTEKTVLDVEREAIVLFCEALQVVGDAFAIAGYSGTGRLGVDYWKAKTFAEPMGEEIRARIGAMAPQRSTRMGAAIRHALSRLETIPKKVRLLITLGDGFPNDTGYKGDYAIADTRRAIAEARSKGIHLRPITVNPIPGQPLDHMYGNRHHTVISDVRELPDKLWRIYTSLTR